MQQGKLLEGILEVLSMAGKVGTGSAGRSNGWSKGEPWEGGRREAEGQRAIAGHKDLEIKAGGWLAVGGGEEPRAASGAREGLRPGVHPASVSAVILKRRGAEGEAKVSGSYAVLPDNPQRLQATEAAV